MWKLSQNPLDPRKWDLYKDNSDTDTGASFFVVPLFLSAISGIFIFEPGTLNHLFWVVAWVVVGLLTHRFNDAWTIFGALAIFITVAVFIGIPLTECGKKLYHDAEVANQNKNPYERNLQQRSP